MVARHAVALACLTMLAAPTSVLAADPATHFVWFGTYTQGKSGSEGIYVARFDAASGELSPPVLAAAATNPSCDPLCASIGSPATSRPSQF